MNPQIRGMILIIKSALDGKKYSLPECFDFSKAIRIAKSHQISAIVYYGALNCGISRNLPQMQQLFFEVCGYVSVNERQNYDFGELFSMFEKNKIEYMPLKGTLIKKMYPKEEMRIMSDADILIKIAQYNEIKRIMLSLGYEEILESDHELVWRKNGINIELHKRLIPSYNKDYFEYYGDGWRLARRCLDGSTRYEMSNEDQMIYLFTHFSKHYRDKGIGIKHIIDLWVYRKNIKSLNETYVLSELKKLQLDEFYKNIISTLSVWFEEVESDKITDLITKVIVSSGVYGTREAQVLSTAVKKSKDVGTAKKARNKRIIEVFFPPLNKMSELYPVLRKVKYFLPVMWVVRWFDILIFRRKNLVVQIENIRSMSEKNIDGYQQNLNLVGLDFNFKE